MLHHRDVRRIEAPAWQAQPASPTRPRPPLRRAAAAVTVRPISGDPGDHLALDLPGTRYTANNGELSVDGRRIGRVAGGEGGTALRLTLTDSGAEHEAALLDRVRYSNTSAGAPYARAFLVTTAADGRSGSVRREAVNAAWLPRVAETVAAAVTDLIARGETEPDTSGRLRPLPSATGAGDPALAASVLRALLERAVTGLPRSVATCAPAAAEAGRMSPRQREVLRLVAAGRSNKQIAQELGVSPATVKTHVACALATIGARNRTDAAMRARERGWI